MSWIKQVFTSKSNHKSGYFNMIVGITWIFIGFIMLGGLNDYGVVWVFGGGIFLGMGFGDITAGKSQILAIFSRVIACICGLAVIYLVATMIFNGNN